MNEIYVLRLNHFTERRSGRAQRLACVLSFQVSISVIPGYLNLTNSSFESSFCFLSFRKSANIWINIPFPPLLCRRSPPPWMNYVISCMQHLHRIISIITTTSLQLTSAVCENQIWINLQILKWTCSGKSEMIFQLYLQIWCQTAPDWSGNASGTVWLFITCKAITSHISSKNRPPATEQELRRSSQSQNGPAGPYMVLPGVEEARAAAQRERADGRLDPTEQKLKSAQGGQERARALDRATAFEGRA